MKERLRRQEPPTPISTRQGVSICWNRGDRTFDMLTREWICDEPGGRLYEADVIWTQQPTYRLARRYRWEFLQKMQEQDALEAQEGLKRYTYTPSPEDIALVQDALRDVFDD